MGHEFHGLPYCAVVGGGGEKVSRSEVPELEYKPG